MASESLQSLPPELLHGVAEQLEQADRLGLSATNSHFRVVLAPSVFRILRLDTQPDRDWDSFRRLASKHAQYVRELHFIGRVCPPTEDGDATHNPEIGTGNGSQSSQESPRRGGEISEPSNSLILSSLIPGPIVEALSGSLFPEADTARVTFDFDFAKLPPEGGVWEHESDIISPEDTINSIYVFEIPENDENVTREKEIKYPWRALMAEFWRVLSQNHSIRNLVAQDLLPKPTSTFFSKQWVQFLARLWKLEIRMWCGDNAAGWEANTLDGYAHFEQHLSDYFLQHAAHTTTLLLVAEFDLSCTLPLRSHHMPELQHLALHDMFLTQEISNFVTQANSSLKSLVLRNCHADVSRSEDTYTWAKFLTLLDNDDIHLTKLDIGYDKVFPMLDSEESEDPDPSMNRDDPARVAKLQELRQDPGMKAFSYGFRSEAYGSFWDNSDANYENYVRGEDRMAYNSLVARIRRNAGKLNGII